MSRSFLYVVSAFDLIKVGTSRDPDRRARAIYGQLLHRAPVSDDKAADAEAYAHTLLKVYEESSEWFRCDPAIAIAAVIEAAQRAKTGAALETPDRLANRRRGLVRASQRRADMTAEKLKIALEMWFDLNFTVTEISKRCGLSRHTLYDNLPPRFTRATD